MEEEIFENERYVPFRGWGHTWPGHFLPTDRVGHWSLRGDRTDGPDGAEFNTVAPGLKEVRPGRAMPGRRAALAAGRAVFAGYPLIQGPCKVRKANMTCQSWSTEDAAYQEWTHLKGCLQRVDTPQRLPLVKPDGVAINMRASSARAAGTLSCRAELPLCMALFLHEYVGTVAVLENNA